MEGPVPFFLGIDAGTKRGQRQADDTVSRLSRARISFPVLKKGTAFFETWTATPVRGLRPVCAARILAENAPKPRSSTRSPRRKASIISFSIALTTLSMSRSKRCGFCEEMRFMSSDFIIDQKLANWRDLRQAAKWQPCFALIEILSVSFQH